MKYSVKSHSESKESVFDVEVTDTRVVEESSQSFVVEAECVFIRTVKGDKIVSSNDPPKKFVDELKGGFYQESYRGNIRTNIQDADVYNKKAVSKVINIELIKSSQTEGIELTNALGEFKGKIGSNSINLSLEATLNTADEGCAFIAIGKNTIATITIENDSKEFFDAASYSSKTVPYSLTGNSPTMDYRGFGSDFAQRTGLTNGTKDGFKVVKQSDGTELLNAPKKDGNISELRYSEDGKYFGVSSGNTKFHDTQGSTVVFDAENSYNKVAEIRDGQDSDTHDFSKNNKYLAIGQFEGGVAIVDTSDWSVTTRLLGTTEVDTVRFDQALEVLYVYTSEPAAYEFDIQNNFAKNSLSFSSREAEWFGGRYLVVKNGTNVEIRDKNNSYNVVSSATIAEEVLDSFDINNDGTKIVVGQSSGSKTQTGQPEVYSTGFSPGPDLGSKVQTDSSGVVQTNSSGVILTQS
jgi:hypothetical protein